MRDRERLTDRQVDRQRERDREREREREREKVRQTDRQRKSREVARDYYYYYYYRVNNYPATNVVACYAILFSPPQLQTSTIYLICDRSNYNAAWTVLSKLKFKHQAPRCLSNHLTLRLLFPRPSIH